MNKNEAPSMVNKAESITKKDALEHVEAVKRMGKTVNDPKEYFTKKIKEIADRLERERKLDPYGEEMVMIRARLSPEEYFKSLEGVLEFQKSYLKALDQ